MIVSEVEVELERYCCCELRILARNGIWSDRSKIVRRWSVNGLDIVCVGLKPTSLESDGKDKVSRVVPGRIRAHWVPGHFEDRCQALSALLCRETWEGRLFGSANTYTFRLVFSHKFSDSRASSSILHGPSDATATSSSRTCSFVDRCRMSLDRQGYRQLEARA